MKVSNLILLCALGAILIFMTALQIKMGSYVKQEVQRDYGNFKRDTREVKAFKNLEVSNGIKVIFEQNEKTVIQVEAWENLMDFVSIAVVDRTLIIKKAKRISEKDSVTVRVSNPRLDSLNVSGASFYTKGPLSGSTVKLVFHRKAKGNLELNYELVECSFSASSEISLTGKSKEVNFKKE